MRARTAILTMLVWSCGAPEKDPGPTDSCAAQTLRECVSLPACDWDGTACGEAEGDAPPTLAQWYRGSARTDDAGELAAELRFVDDGRVALLSVGDTGYGVELLATPSGALLVSTSAAHCTSSCIDDALTLEGRLDEDSLDFSTVLPLGGNTAPFNELRMVPHDGVKPVHNPALEEPYDPAPVAGVYVGLAYAPGASAAGECEVILRGEPLEIVSGHCGTEAGSAPDLLSWDPERMLLNAPLGDHLLVARLSAEHDGTFTGVLADHPIPDPSIAGPMPLAPEDIGFTALIGTFDLTEGGAR